MNYRTIKRVLKQRHQESKKYVFPRIIIFIKKQNQNFLFKLKKILINASIKILHEQWSSYFVYINWAIFQRNCCNCLQSLLLIVTSHNKGSANTNNILKLH